MLNISLSRSLGPAGLGLFSLVLSTSQAFELTARGGVDYGLTCELTGSAAGRSEQEKASIAACALSLVQTSTLVLALSLWIWVVPCEGLLPIDLRSGREATAAALVVIAILESLSGIPWDLLIISGDTKRGALRQGLFAPLKLLLAVIGAAVCGVPGALIGYGLVSAAQLRWLQKTSRRLWQLPSRFTPDWQRAWRLLRGGMALYGTNAIAALVFLPLMSEVARESGVADVGYLRVGQIMVQLFTLLPGALTPLLFLRLRETSNDNKQENFETSLRLIWWIGLAALLAYLLVDQTLIQVFFRNRGIPCYLADASLEVSPEPGDELISFSRCFIGASTFGDFLSLGDWIASVRVPEEGDLVMQMDIEGWEYQALLTCPDSLLQRCRVLVIEFHDFHRCLDFYRFRDVVEPLFSKLSKIFDPVHIHANNASFVFNYAGYACPSAFELTLHRRDRRLSDVSSVAAQLPHCLDFPNCPDRRDHLDFARAWPEHRSWN